MWCGETNINYDLAPWGLQVIKVSLGRGAPPAEGSKARRGVAGRGGRVRGDQERLSGAGTLAWALRNAMSEPH